MTTTRPLIRKRPPYRLLVWAGLASLVLAAGVTGYLHRGKIQAAYQQITTPRRQEKPKLGAIHTAARGPIRITVRETGTVQAVKSIQIMSEVEGQARIISIVPEGTRVNQGDILVELDSSDIREKLSQESINLESAKASLTEAKESLEIQKNQNQSDIRGAELKVEFAEVDLKKYEEGDWPQERRNAQADITIAEEELKRARNRLQWTEKLQVEGFVTREELEADSLAVKKAELSMERAKEDLRILEKYTYPKRLKELQSKVTETKGELERVKLRANAQLLQKDAAYSAKQATLALQEEKTKKLGEQLQKCKMFAPAPGLVVYYSEARRWGSSESAIEAGSLVRLRQILITLPDVSLMRADVDIHEASVQKIRTGLPAVVTVDALPSQRFQGHVRKIASIADSQQFWINPDLKVYKTEVLLDSQIEGLKPGMSAMVEILVDELADVLRIPIQAVFTHDEQPCCYVLAGDRIEARALQVGPSNEQFVVIEAGLEAGEQVMLYRPQESPNIAKVGFERIKKAESPVVSIPPPAQDAGKETPGREANAPGQPAPPPSDPIAGTPPPGNPEASPPPGDREGTRHRNLTPEQVEKMKERLKNMTPEQREEFMKRRRERGASQ